MAACKGCKTCATHAGGGMHLTIPKSATNNAVQSGITQTVWHSAGQHCTHTHTFSTQVTSNARQSASHMHFPHNSDSMQSCSQQDKTVHKTVIYIKYILHTTKTNKQLQSASQNKNYIHVVYILHSTHTKFNAVCKPR